MIGKLIEILKVYPWSNLFAAVVSVMVIFMFLGMISPRRTRLWIQKVFLSLTLGFNGLLLIFSIILVLFCSFFLILWISHIQVFSSLENYLVNLFLIVSFSFFFGTIAFLIHFFDNQSYKIDNVNLDNFIRHKVSYADTIDKMEKEIELLKSLLQKLDAGLHLDYLGSIKDSNELKVRAAIKENNFEKEKYAVEIYQINSSNEYLVQVNTLKPPGTNVLEDYILTEELYVHLESDLFSYPDLYFSFYKAVKERDTKPKEFNRLHKHITSQINELEEISIKALRQLSNERHLKISTFLYVYLLEIFSMGQSYIIPFSLWAKINHLCFGVYRFVMIGTFISLLIKYVST